MKKIKFSFNSEVEKIIKKFSLNNDWNKNINQDIDKYKSKKFNKKSFNRKDLKKLDFVTIDGEDAKDFDDAVYCEKHESNWKLYVAIADVAHYVENNSNIDKEARKRGTSVYFPGFVIPMLPEVLSNNLCSLRPGEDKFTVMAEIIIGKDGKIKSYKFYNALISSSARLTYTQVDDFLNKKKGESRLVMREGVAPVPEVCTWKAPVLHSMKHRNRRRYPLLRAHQALQRAAHSLTELLERIYEQSQLGQNGSILRQHRLGVLTHEPAKSSQHHCA